MSCCSCTFFCSFRLIWICSDPMNTQVKFVLIKKQFTLVGLGLWSAELRRIRFGQWFGQWFGHRPFKRHFFWWENPPKLRGAQFLARRKNSEDRLSWNTDKGSSSSDCRMRVVNGDKCERFIFFWFIFAVFLLNAVKIMQFLLKFNWGYKDLSRFGIHEQETAGA